MKISQLIEELQELQKLRGDIDVYAWPRPRGCDCGAETIPLHEIMDDAHVIETKYFCPGNTGGATIAMVEA